MEKPFPAYSGADPYTFVCYAHDDDEVVYPEMGWLREQGINLWYDEGISAGRIWREEIGERIKGASHVLVFLSTASLASAHCSREIHFALDQQKAIVPVYLEDVALTTDLEMGLSAVQALRRHDTERYRQGLLNALNRPAAITGKVLPSRLRSASRMWVLALGIVFLPALAALLWPSRESPDDRIRFDTIAVLPFTDLTADQDLGPLANGVTQQLVTRLDELPNVKVAVAPAPAVPLLLKGALQRDGPDIEALVQIVRASDMQVLWSSPLSRAANDQTIVARFIAGELSRFVGSVSSHPRPGPASTDAYRAWLNWHYLKANRRNWDEVRWIEQVIRLEPEYAWAHLEAFESYFSAAWDGQDRRWIERARNALEAAESAGLQAEPEYLIWLGMFLTFMEGDLDRGEALLRQHSDFLYSGFLTNWGIVEPAIKAAEFFTSQQPANPQTWLGLGFAHGMNGDLPGALKAFEEGLRRSPDHPYLLLQRIRCLTFLDRYSEAEKALKHFDSLGPLPAGGALGRRASHYRLEGRQGNRAAALAGAETLAAEGWNASAGQLFLEFDDPRAAEQFELAAANPVAGRRHTSSWLYQEPWRANDPIVRAYLESLGYTPERRREICLRAVDFAQQYGVELDCDLLAPPR